MYLFSGFRAGMVILAMATPIRDRPAESRERKRRAGGAVISEGGSIPRALFEVTSSARPPNLPLESHTGSGWPKQHQSRIQRLAGFIRAFQTGWDSLLPWRAPSSLPLPPRSDPPHWGSSRAFQLSQLSSSEADDDSPGPPDRADHASILMALPSSLSIPSRVHRVVDSEPAASRSGRWPARQSVRYCPVPRRLCLLPSIGGPIIARSRWSDLWHG